MAGEVRRAVYPGTFDPPHQGHLDLIQRGLELVDELVVAVAINRDKRFTFSEEERVELLQDSVPDRNRVRVIPFNGLVVDLLSREQAQFLLRGIRTFSDFEAEYTMALTNRQLAGADTIFVLPTLNYSHFSSKLIKEIASFGGEVRDFLPPEIADRVMERLSEQL